MGKNDSVYFVALLDTEDWLLIEDHGPLAFIEKASDPDSSMIWSFIEVDLGSSLNGDYIERILNEATKWEYTYRVERSIVDEYYLTEKRKQEIDGNR